MRTAVGSNVPAVRVRVRFTFISCLCSACVFIFHFQFHSSWASLLVKAVLGAGCFAMKSEVQETEGLVQDPVSSMYLLMTEIADRGSDERPG